MTRALRKNSPPPTPPWSMLKLLQRSSSVLASTNLRIKAAESSWVMKARDRKILDISLFESRKNCVDLPTRWSGIYRGQPVNHMLHWLHWLHRLHRSLAPPIGE